MTPPLEFSASAQLIHINARKEGPEEDKILATDLKLVMEADNELLLAFHPQLRLMLYTKEGEPRFPQMEDVGWDQEFREMVLELTPETGDLFGNGPHAIFQHVKLKKWVFRPRANGRVAVAFQAQVKPEGREFQVLGRLYLEDAIRISVKRGEEETAEPTASTGAAGPEEKDVAVHSTLPIGDPPSSATPEAPPAGNSEVPTELTPQLLQKVREAGAAEARKLEDERDFDTGLAAALRALGLSRAFVDEHLGELQTSFADGYEEELAKAE